jgi:hypothetical protein
MAGFVMPMAQQKRADWQNRSDVLPANGAP